MNIRTKILSITGFAVLCVIVIIYLVASPLILHGFEKVENKNVQENVGRGSDAIQVQLESLALKTFDWGSWDDPYSFMGGKSNDFIESNFGDDEQYKNPVFDTLLYYDTSNRLKYSNGGIRPSAELLNQLKPGNPLFKYSSGEVEDPETSDVRGIITLKDSLLLVVARPVLRTDSTGPSLGTVMLVRFLNDNYKEEIAKSTHLNLHIYSTADPKLPAEAEAVKTSLGQKDISVRVLDAGRIGGYTLVNDLYGNPSVILTVEQPRDIYSQGKDSLQVFLYIMSGVGLAFVLLTFILLEFIVIRRMVALSSKVTHIKNEETLTTRLNFKGKDEVAQLAHSINHMLMRIKDSNLRVHSLVGQLEHEKEGVERLVRQRTTQLEEEKTRFMASINSLPLGFILLNKEGAILMLNPTIEKMLDLSVENINAMVTGKGDKHIMLEKLIAHAQKAARRRNIASFELTSPNGRFLHTLVSPVVSRHGDADGIVVLVEDVTEARILDRSKEEFFSIASHELRTPLTAIRGNASLIQEFYQEQMKDDGLAGMVGDIHNSSIRLIEIVNDFLDASTLEQSKMKFSLEDFDLQEVIDKVADELSAVALEKKIQLKTHKADKPIIMHSDSNRIKQVIYNLIGNAVKFTAKGSITFSTEITPDGKFAKVLVTDTGPGIAPEGQQILFHKFQQSGPNLHTRDASRGTGLGLYISKLIVEQLGGKIALENSQQHGEHHGTTFSITLPIK